MAVTETRWHQVRCRCGRVMAARVPDDVPDALYYGPNLAALAHRRDLDRRRRRDELRLACADTLALFTLDPRSKAGAAAAGVLPRASPEQGSMTHCGSATGL